MREGATLLSGGWGWGSCRWLFITGIGTDVIDQRTSTVTQRVVVFGDVGTRKCSLIASAFSKDWKKEER